MSDQQGPSDGELDAFKGDVRTWLDIDRSIRELQASLRERRAAKRALTGRVGDFMTRYNVEDLRTREGSRLRFRMTMVRAPLSHVDIRDRLARHIEARYIAAGGSEGGGGGGGSEDRARIDADIDDMNVVLFGNREKVERPTLRRMPTPVPKLPVASS